MTIPNFQQLQCSHCGKVFKYKSDKTRHERSHSRQFECKLCMKKFSFLSALHRHEKQHERKRSIECLNCNKLFKDESLLKRHIQYAHKGLFHCIECAGVFNSKLALQNHSIIHRTGQERRYKCKYDGCNKAFNFSHHLKHHVLTHSKEKQYFCSECGKGFIQKHHFNDHLKTHKPELHHLCPVGDCESKFSTETSRRKHIKKYHSEFKETLKKSVLNCNEEDLKETNEDRESENSIKEVLNNNQADFKEDNGLPLDDCKTALGVCIMTGNKEGNADCLCDQITCNSIDNRVQNKLDQVDLEKDDVPNKNLVQIDLSNDIDSPNITCHNSKPKIENSNGVIKLRDPIDSNIQKNDCSGHDFVPYNSCKDILGNCIVSGNDTMGKGCLCAKMNIDSNYVSDQEVNEISVGKSWF